MTAAPKRYQHYLFGEFVERDHPLTVEEAREALAEGRRRASALQDVPVDRIVEVLHRAGELWGDPAYPGRIKALEFLPGLVGFSPKMTELALDTLAWVMHRRSVQPKVRLELRNPAYLDDWTFHPVFQGYYRALPLGLVLHVSAGNVFIGGADSLIHGLLTKNTNLVKAAGADPLFPLLFARSLLDADPEGTVARSFAVVAFRGGDEPVERVMKEGVDAIVVWGGRDAVAAYREGVPPETALIPYGPKYSFSVVTARGLADEGLDQAAYFLARDVAMWEQRACSSPHVIFVEQDGDSDRPGAVAQAVAGALEQLAGEIPPGHLSFDEQVEILRTRELARMGQALGESRLFTPPSGAAWTVIQDASPDFTLSPMNRCVTVKPFASSGEIVASLEGMKTHLQSASILGSPNEVRLLATAFVRAGVSRITEIGKMFVGKPGAPHDGGFQLQALVKWAHIESVARRFDQPEALAGAAAETPWERLQAVTAYAREHSPYYREALAAVDLRDPADFLQAPFLDRRHIYEHTPPVGEGMLTGPLEQAYVFASGGSTGAPKFSFYSYTELDRVTDILAEVYAVAGVTAEDTAANLFMAGNLWTSFLVANQAFEKIGCVTLPIAGNADIDLVIRYLQLFKPTALIGIPSIIIQLAEEVERRRLQGVVAPRTILYGGEHLSADAKQYLGRVLGAERICSAGYASVDGGPIGFQCPQCLGTVHHLLEEYQYLEIVDQETGAPAAAGKPGEIVITNLHRTLMPIIRYRTGDLGRFTEGPCGCGRRSPRFELLGRCDDVVRVGSVSMYPDEVGALLGRVAGVSRLFQLEASRRSRKDLLTVRAEASDESADRQALADQVKNVIVEQHGELAEALREGWLGALEVEILPAGALPRVKRTGKIKRVVDLR